MATPKIKDLLSFAKFEPGDVMMSVDPATRFGFISSRTEGGTFEPLRVDGRSRVLIPTHDWSSMGVSEEAQIIQVLLTAGAANPLVLPTSKAINPDFWVKNRTHRSAAILRPDSKVYLPVGTTVFRSEQVPSNQMLLLGKPSNVGYYIQQGYRRNILAHDSKGLLLVTFSS